jgi:zinc/manganese transport system substrate-binding protein/manganese/iron transport system substrate-binding protein
VVARRSAGVLVAVLTGTLLAGCASGAAPPPDPAGRVRVVATTTVIADFVRNAGGDRVAVTQILAPNVDPHEYEPSPADLLAISRADLVVRNGAGLEPWLDPALDAAGYTGPVLDAGAGVPLRIVGTGPDAEPDPHIWHDPRNAVTMVTAIGRALAARHPADAAGFDARTTAYVTALDQLDRTDQAEIDSIPPARRVLITNHDAFGYYAARYGIGVAGAILPSFDTSAELSGGDLSRLVDVIRRTGVPAVFSEASLPAKAATALAAEAGVRVIGGEGSLYADGLGPAGSPGATYLAAERHNTDVISTALGGHA